MGTSSRTGQAAPGLAPETAEVLQAATRVLAGVALRSLDVLDGAVTLPQFRMLAVLADLGRARSAQVARALGLDASTVTRLADRLTAAGHITRGREPGHRSVVTLELTATGQHLVSQAAAWREQELARILRQLPPAGRRQVTTMLRQLVEAAGEGYGTNLPHPGPYVSGSRQLAMGMPLRSAVRRAFRLDYAPRQPHAQPRRHPACPRRHGPGCDGPVAQAEPFDCAASADGAPSASWARGWTATADRPPLPGGRHRSRTSRGDAAAYPPGPGVTEPPAMPGWDADQAVAGLYDAQYCAFTRLAALLVIDVAAAEEIVQAAFAAMHRGWRHLRDSDKALAYLLRKVVIGARSCPAARPRPASRGMQAGPVPGRAASPSPASEALLLAALHALPARQREALVLRYYAGLPDTQIAAAMGISARAVTGHIGRGMTTLQAAHRGTTTARPPPVIQPETPGAPRRPGR